jgi:hypothetical protein
MYTQVTAKKKYMAVSYVSLRQDAVMGVIIKEKNTLLSDFSRLLGCLHRSWQGAAVCESTILLMYKKDEWSDSRFSRYIPKEKAAVSL